MATNLPKFSVVTPSYNQGKYIRQTIESVLWQKYPNVEHIIIDGGSTDATLSILRQYPHLSWISEPDNGQSDALNKALAKATGDIIAWINADDWYAVGAFYAVAEAFKHSSIVMGACEFVDKYGIRKEVIPNIERNWTDLLKYWVYHSSPAQPSVFFSRSLLEKVKLQNSTIIEEDLQFCMDWELWLRIGMHAEFSTRIPKVLSYFRVHDEAKTGQYGEATYKETSRVFRRYTNSILQPEQNFSFIIPVRKRSDIQLQVVHEIANQSYPNIEIVFVGYDEEKSETRALRKKVTELQSQFPSLALRMISAFPTYLDAIDEGIKSARAPLACVLSEHTSVPESFALQASQCFSSDSLGVLFPAAQKTFTDLLFESQNGQHQLNLSALFSPLSHPRSFVVRTFAYHEAGGLRVSGEKQVPQELGWKRLLLLLCHKSWSLRHLSFLQPEKGAVTVSSPFFLDYVNATLINVVEQDIANNPFSSLKIQHGFALNFSKELYERASSVLKRVSEEWKYLTPETQILELEDALRKWPNFSPSYALLSEAQERMGNISAATMLRNTWQTLRNEELIS